MSFLVRPVEALWSEVIAIQAEKQNAELASGVKRFAAAAGGIPPNDNWPSNLKDMTKMKKYFNLFKKDNANKLGDFMPNINKQSLTKILKYLA